MSGARTIEVQDDPIRHVFAVRLCDGDQVLATREFSERDLMLGGKAWRDWDTARKHMRRHEMLTRLRAGPSEVQQRFEAAVAVLFPGFGTVPDGVETTT